MTDARPSISRARRLAAAALAAGLVLGLGACGGDDDEDAADQEETSPEENSPAGTNGGGDDDGASMTLTESQFEDLSVAAGGTIEVTNDSGVPHTMTADDGEFDEELPDGETTPVTAPSEPGEYGFHCEIHPSMTATLTVS
jgi:plastocyanin